MATGQYGIATELEAKNKIGSTASVNDSKLITRDRVYEIGGAILSGQNYTQELCVLYAHIIVPTPIMHTWYMLNNLVWPYSVTQKNEPTPDERYDALFFDFDNYYATYYPYSQYDFSRWYECGTILEAYCPSVSQPASISPGNYDIFDIMLFSNCSPFDENQTRLSNYEVPYTNFYTSAINTTSYLYYDVGGGGQALRDEFPLIYNFDDFMNFFGSLGHLNDYSNLIIYNDDGLRNHHIANMKAGQEFFILFQNIGGDVNKTFELHLGMLCITNDHLIYLNTHDPIYIGGLGTEIKYWLCYDPVNCDIWIGHNETESVFELTFMIANTGDMIVRFRNVYNGSDLFMPYITNFGLNMHASSPDEMIYLCYDYFEGLNGGWRLLYLQYEPTIGLGLDSLAMYLIRFFLNLQKDAVEKTFLLPEAANINCEMDVNSEGFDLLPSVFLGMSFEPFYTDFCFLNPAYVGGGSTVEVNVSARKLNPSEKLYDESVGFAVTYLRAPVFFNADGSVFDDLGIPLYAENNYTYNYTMFPYESELSHGNFSYNSFIMFLESYLNTWSSFTYNEIEQFFKASVPYIVIYDPLSGTDTRLPLDGGFLYYLWQEGFFGDGGSWNDETIKVFMNFGDGWWGIPEWLFFTDSANNVYYNMVKVIEHPRAILVIIPLQQLGYLYNTFYDGTYGTVEIFDKMYIYYKTYFYRYDLI